MLTRKSPQFAYLLKIVYNGSREYTDDSGSRPFFVRAWRGRNMMGKHRPKKITKANHGKRPCRRKKVRRWKH
jgi:hypothetical protein